MKITIDAAIIHDTDGETGKESIELEQIGTMAWVRMKIGSQTWDIDFRDFWNAARAVGIETTPL